MPELPDVTVYVEALEARCTGQHLERIRIVSPTLLRSVEPTPTDVAGLRVRGVRRLGKRIVFALERDFFAVVHLMIAGRLHWRPRKFRLGRKQGLASFDFDTGSLLLTEASSRKRASLHLVRSEAELAQHDPGGLEVLEASGELFATRLLSANHTLKRALTDPRLFSGIGNAYSDEILHRARLSPVKLTRRLDSEEIDRLYAAVRETLIEWTQRLRDETGDRFPEHVTAFREGMAVHGRHRKPCPDCGSPVQRIVYARNETNYCARCQTGGRLLADRALSQLLKQDWPRSLDELEARLAGDAGPIRKER